MDASNEGFVRLGDKDVVIHNEVCSKLVYTQATCGIIITGIILSMENMSKIRLSKLEGICLVTSILSPIAGVMGNYFSWLLHHGTEEHTVA